MDLTQFEKTVDVRPLRSEDFEGLVTLQRACFPGMSYWTERHFQSMLANFPEGQLGVEIEGQLVAASSSLAVDFGDYSEWHDWAAISDGGFIRNHDPDGDTLYGIEMMVHPDFRGRKLSRRLYDARKVLIRKLNLQRMIVGGRIPGYKEHAHEISAREYVDRVIEKRLFDPVLTTQLANGFVLKGLIPGYLPEDDDSRGYATYLEWTNLDYRAPHRRRGYRTVTPVRISVVQWAMRKISKWESFAQQCEFFVDTASDYKADLVVFPELFTTELLSIVDESRPAEEARALAAYTPRYLELFRELAISYDINVVAGSQLTLEDRALYNVAYLFRRDGSIEQQRKLHITPAERRWWGVQGGEKLDVFDTDCGKLAILICYDVEFPELARVAVERGAQILCVPYNTTDRHGYHRVKYCAQARCIENHVYVVAAGCVGNLPMVENADTHYAQSAIYTPSDVEFARDGIAAQCTPNVEMILTHEVDTQLLKRHRRFGSVTNWLDRRLDLYKLGWTPDHAEPPPPVTPARSDTPHG